jgi:predicted RNA binding protein YcfA (HicA-like mRNA interferase family)
MPRKLRQLIADLERAGFVHEPGRGSHRKFRHANGTTAILSGHNVGVDAKTYQEKHVRLKIEESKKTAKEEKPESKKTKGNKK